ncbi:MAG: hypothetical protein CL693_17880 [Cellvibrionaceae bacterium]|nr:hypothetical protein [Cellvibrionaceae bacterium]|tara:strand:- start:2838 stop:4484 length:1647 start_codon:yes stop_codon:yes gene_type:complete
MVGDIQLDEALWQRLIELSGAAVLLTDVDGTIQFVNQRFTEVSGYSSEDVIGKTPSLLNSGRTPPALHKQIWARIRDGKIWRGRILNRNKAGGLYWAMQSIAPIHNAQGRMTRFLSVSDNISEWLNRDSNQHGFYDSETGVGNHHLLELDIAAELQRKDFSPCELVLVEFTNKVGGKVIAKVLAERLSLVAGNGGSIYRLSKRRFAVLLTQSARSIREFSLQAPSVLNESVTLGFDQIIPRLFIGAAHGLNGSFSKDELLARAEESLEEAKGRTTIGNLFSRDQSDVGDEELFEDLCAGLDNNQLHLAAQSIVDQASGRVAAIEFLLRWQHPQLGYISPLRIISVAEKYGYLYKIAIYVVERILTTMPKNVLHDSTTCLAINFNLPQITNRVLINDVLQMIDGAGVERSRFIFEVTETEALPVDAKDAADIFQWVRDQGVILALDDFGAGYSTLDYLSQFQVDIVKLDRNLLMDINQNERRRMTFKAMLKLCQNLGATVVVEGIETKEQLEFIKQLGVTNLLLQGYYLFRPCDLSDDSVEMMEVLNAK